MSKCALLTITGNEPDFLKMWYAYYSQHFDDKDIYIIDNESDPQYMEGAQGTIIRTGTGIGYDGDTHIRVSLNKNFNKLLQTYDYVLCHDVDMFVVPDPDKWPDGLKQYIEEFTDVYAQCSGYNVIDTVGTNLITDSQPWLMQRVHWYREWRHLCKVVFASQDPEWGGGLHHSKWNRTYQREIGANERTDFRLLHFGFICERLVRRRWSARVAIPDYAKGWNPDDARKCVDGVAADIKYDREEIPEKWRLAL